MADVKQPGERYRCLDHWRGLLCLFVVLEHAGVVLWPNLADTEGVSRFLMGLVVGPLHWNVAAPLFFVVSGYCVAASLDSSRRKGKSPWEFLARRAWRIFPPYWAALALFVSTVACLDLLGLERWHRNGLTLELPSPGELSARQWFGNLTLTETWRPRAVLDEPLIFTRVAWSLCYQEQFYVVCFVLLLAFRARFFRALAIATAAIVGLAVLAWDCGATRRIDGTFPMLWHEFAIGLGVYWRLSYPGTRRQYRAIELAIVAALVAGLWHGMASTWASALFGLMLIAAKPWDERIGSIRRLEPLKALGRCSYSIYLIHMPVCVVVLSALDALGVGGAWPRLAVMFPLATLASLGVGVLFHRWVDSRFTQLPRVRLRALGAAGRRREPEPLAA